MVEVINRRVPVGAGSSSPEGEVLLDIKDLKTYFYTMDGVVKAVLASLAERVQARLR